MKVAIIGAGASGLTAIKCCLDEGLIPFCFEKQNFIGGLWNYTPSEKDGATVYQSTVINTSKEMMCFSDFPIPKEFPNYMHNTKVQEYFELYAERFSLKKHISFMTEVLSCKLSDGFSRNGQWTVTTKDLKTEKVTTGQYDGVLVCVGHHAFPYFPLSSFPGIEKFKGKYTHSHSYRNHVGYENLKVAVVGIGNSGGDIAVELSRHAKKCNGADGGRSIDIVKKITTDLAPRSGAPEASECSILNKLRLDAKSVVFLSTRRGSWILKRIHENGMPLDFEMNRKFLMTMRKFVPHSFTDAFARKSIDNRIDHAKYSLRPDRGVFSQHPMVNDDIANRIITGTVVVKSNIAHFTENSAVFDDGTEEEIDAVIFATGYSINYKFLDDTVLKVTENDADLYKYMYPTTLAKNTLAIIGCIQPLGAINPISEIQCRWATRVIKGDVALPGREEMQQDIESKRFNMQRRYVKSRRHTVQVDYVEYMDELADQISCRPEITKLLLQDPLLAMKVFFGPALPYIYRIQGPGAWPGARKAIMTASERVLYPLATRKINTAEGGGVLKIVLMAIMIAVIAWFVGII